jgi:hypothetical protein
MYKEEIRKWGQHSPHQGNTEVRVAEETREDQLRRWARKGAWIGVDLDGTLAYYDHWRGEGHIGQPIPAMVERVKQWLAAGVTVKIFTARADDRAAVTLIRMWTNYTFNKELEVTNKKDFGLVELWDDRAIQVVANTGARADGKE